MTGTDFALWKLTPCEPLCVPSCHSPETPCPSPGHLDFTKGAVHHPLDECAWPYPVTSEGVAHVQLLRRKYKGEKNAGEMKKFLLKEVKKCNHIRLHKVGTFYRDDLVFCSLCGKLLRILHIPAGLLEEGKWLQLWARSMYRFAH